MSESWGLTLLTHPKPDSEGLDVCEGLRDTEVSTYCGLSLLGSDGKFNNANTDSNMKDKKFS